MSPPPIPIVIWDMDFHTQINPDDESPFGGAENSGVTPAFVGVYGVLSAIWLWLASLAREVLERRVVRADYYPTWDAFPVNRAARLRRARYTRRSVPPAQNLEPFYAIGPNVSPTQFLERLCRLSGQGRVYVYEMVYWSHRMTREAFMAIFARGCFRMPDGLCHAHIAPD